MQRKALRGDINSPSAYVICFLTFSGTAVLKSAQTAFMHCLVNLSAEVLKLKKIQRMRISCKTDAQH